MVRAVSDNRLVVHFADAECERNFLAGLFKSGDLASGQLVSVESFHGFGPFVECESIISRTSMCAVNQVTVYRRRRRFFAVRIRDRKSVAVITLARSSRVSIDRSAQIDMAMVAQNQIAQMVGSIITSSLFCEAICAMGANHGLGDFVTNDAAGGENQNGHVV